jgi:alkylation response protein AidB-like acyl-CoA dehydrogenase|tara:strand:+ start:1069 stop:2187 length:1119 start_codon:yes stop_codon:yes gene_type:complete
LDFGLTETQELIRTTAREFLADRSDSSVARAVANGDTDALESLWKDIVELGWPALIISEEHGGAGLSFGDFAVLLEELGASLAPTPIVESAITSRIIERFGSNDLKSDLLPKAATGDALITPAIVERDASWDATSPTVAATKTDTGLVITGEKRFVAFAEQATHALTLVRTDKGDPALVVVPISESGGIEQIPLEHVAGTPVSSVSFNELEVPEANIVATGDDAIRTTEELIATGSVARAAQLAGLGRAVMDATVEYASNREQFGQVVGSFQAIQHHLAEMAIASKQVNHLVHSAAWSFSQDGYSVERAAKAKIAASEKISALCWNAHQCHGAIGFTWEHDLHLYTRRALAWKTDYGDSSFHKSKLADAMGL